MNNNEILDNNLFVEFMGKKHIELCWKLIPSNYVHLPKYFKYNSSYEWLMPVLEKIESLGYGWEIGMQTPTSPYHYCKIDGMDTIEGIYLLDAIYGACIEFIKWYNKLK